MRVWVLPVERMGRGTSAALAVVWIAGLRWLRSKEASNS